MYPLIDLHIFFLRGKKQNKLKVRITSFFLPWALNMRTLWDLVSALQTVNYHVPDVKATSGANNNYPDRERQSLTQASCPGGNGNKIVREISPKAKNSSIISWFNEQMRAAIPALSYKHQQPTEVKLWWPGPDVIHNSCFTCYCQPNMKKQNKNLT